LEGLGVVAAAREVRHPPFSANAFDNAEKRILLDPDLRTVELMFPRVFAVLLRGGLDDGGGAVSAVSTAGNGSARAAMSSWPSHPAGEAVNS
jgi:hypothetical protein